MTKAEAATIVAYLNAAYPRESIEAETFDVYIVCLTDLRLRPAKLAAQQVVKEERYFPTVATFRNYYKSEVESERRKRSETHGLPEPDRAPPPAETVEKLKELGVIDQATYDRLLAASGGDETQAARVASEVGRVKGR